MRKYLISLIFLIQLAGCGTTNRPTVLNLDFETASQNALPAKWHVSNAWGYRCNPTIDSDQRQHGRSSLRLMQIDTVDGWGHFYQYLPPEQLAGRTLTLTGWIKTQGVWKGYADLWMLASGDSDSVLLFDDGLRGIRNSSEWTQVLLKKEISPNAGYLVFGGVLNGCGTAWFDNLELTVDGIKLQDTIIAPAKTELLRKERKALRKYVYPLRTFEPDGGTDDDLQVFGQMIGDAKVVALGENTHGSHEIFKMKDRLIRYLVTDKEFSLFTIEADMSASDYMNEYLQGSSTREQFLADFPIGSWYMPEILDALDWMRRCNQSGRRIAYWGFDMQYHGNAIAVLKKSLGGIPQITPLIDGMRIGLDTISTVSPLGFTRINPITAKAIDADLDKLAQIVAEAAYDNPEKAWLMQQIALLRQFIGQGPYLTQRDRCMAENLLWIKDQNPSSKIIAWAHNDHIKKSEGMMGNFLADSLKEDYLTVGFTFYGGSYKANGQIGVSNVDAQYAYPGTLEYVLNQLDEPIFMLDLKKMRTQNDPMLEWIDNLQYRSVGAIKQVNEFTGRNISDDFDYLIFIRQSTPSHKLETRIQRPPKI